MSILARIKSAFSSQPFLQASARLLRGNESIRPTFSHHQAVSYYSSWIYAAANLNAVAVASQPLRLYVRNRSAGTKLWDTRKAPHQTKAYLSGSLAHCPSRYAMTKAAEYGDDYEVVTEAHPLLTLLSKVNPYQNGFDATVLRVLYGELTGNAYIHPVMDQRLRRPVALWTMPSQYVEIVPDKEQFISGYLYGTSRDQRHKFAADEVIHFKRPNPSDLYYGLGKVEAAWGAATSNAAVHDMDYHFFANKARPDYLMTVKSHATPEELDRLEAQIDEKLRGSKRTGRFLTSTAEIDIKPLSFPPKDLAGREQIVEEIAAVFGVPVSMLKANDPNLASATVGFTSWKATMVLPLLRMDEETLNQGLLPLFGIEEDAFLCYDNPVAEDKVFALDRVRSLVMSGLMTTNEGRELQGLPRVKDRQADRLLVNGQPLGGFPPAAPAAAAPLVPTPLPLADSLASSLRLIDAAMDTKAATSCDCVAKKNYPEPEEVVWTDETNEESPSVIMKAVNTQPPQSVADNARRALEVRAEKPESLRGMTAVGIARARDLMNRQQLSEDTIRRMLSFFERHEVDKQGATWEEQGKGWQAWHGWGGDEGFSWARRKVDEFNREQKKSLSACGCSSIATKTFASTLWTKAATPDAADEFDEINEQEAEIGAAVARILDKQVREVLKRVMAAGTPTAELLTEVELLLRSRKWNTQAVAALRPYLEQSLMAGLSLGNDTVAKLAQIPENFNPRNEDLAAYARTESVRLANNAAQSMNEYTVVAVSKILGDSLASDMSIDQIAERVQEWAIGDGDEVRATKTRALMIARTEAQRGARAAEVHAWKSTGLVEGKTWLLAPDSCEFCEQVASSFGIDAIGIDGNFYAKGDTLTTKSGRSMVLDYEDITAPPLHPNCRCSLQPKLSSDYDEIIAEAEAEQEAANRQTRTEIMETPDYEANQERRRQILEGK